MNKIIITFLLISLAFSGSAQADILGLFTFDDCTAMDEGGEYPLYFVSPTVECTCGVDGTAMEFNELADSVYIDSSVKDLFNDDFTLSFYFWPEDDDNPYTLMSIQEDTCTLDSVMVIRYNPLNQDLDFMITENIGLSMSFSANVSGKNCWNHVVITKTESQYSLYLNENFIESMDIGKEFVIGDKHRVRLGFSPCIGVNENSMKGRIDQLEIYDGTLSSNELRALNKFPDQLLTQDTTIISGQSVILETGGTCTPNFSWTPIDNLSSGNDLNPVATPDESTTYFFDVNHPFCSTRDSVTVFIFEGSLDCENLLFLPNIFTPNSDNINDEFEISNAFLIDENLDTTLSSFEIFDRWGAQVFYGNDKGSVWDGTYKGEPAPPATYAYKIEYTCQNNDYEKIGSFNLLR